MGRRWIRFSTPVLRAAAEPSRLAPSERGQFRRSRRCIHHSAQECGAVACESAAGAAFLDLRAQNLREDLVIRNGLSALTVATLAIGCTDTPTSYPTSPRPGNVVATTASFHATVKGPMTLPVGCATGVTACGNAKIAGIGDARFEYAITSFQPLGGSCGAYTATATFTLTDGSELVLDESGTVCGPGKSFFPQPAPHGSYGNPVNGEGTWTVGSASGLFSEVTGGGTNTFHQAGAALTASYTSSDG